VYTSSSSKDIGVFVLSGVFFEKRIISLEGTEKEIGGDWN
jgi:hypothetical protein